MHEVEDMSLVTDHHNVRRIYVGITIVSLSNRCCCPSSWQILILHRPINPKCVVSTLLLFLKLKIQWSSLVSMMLGSNFDFEVDGGFFQSVFESSMRIHPILIHSSMASPVVNLTTLLQFPRYWELTALWQSHLQLMLSACHHFICWYHTLASSWEVGPSWLPILHSSCHWTWWWWLLLNLACTI